VRATAAASFGRRGGGRAGGADAESRSLSCEYGGE